MLIDLTEFNGNQTQLSGDINSAEDTTRGLDLKNLSAASSALTGDISLGTSSLLNDCSEEGKQELAIVKNRILALTVHFHLASSRRSVSQGAAQKTAGEKIETEAWREEDFS